MLLNAMRFGAKRSAKWCKMQCKMVQNGAKCEAKSIKIHCNAIGKAPPEPLKTVLERVKWQLKSGV